MKQCKRGWDSYLGVPGTDSSQTRSEALAVRLTNTLLRSAVCSSVLPRMGHGKVLTPSASGFQASLLTAIPTETRSSRLCCTSIYRLAVVFSALLGLLMDVMITSESRYRPTSGQLARQKPVFLLVAIFVFAVSGVASIGAIVSGLGVVKPVGHVREVGAPLREVLGVAEGPPFITLNRGQPTVWSPSQSKRQRERIV